MAILAGRGSFLGSRAWLGSAAFYVVLVGLALKGPDSENAVLFTAVIPIAVAALQGGLRRAAPHAAVATCLVWAAGILRPYRVWLSVSAIQTVLFWVIAVVVGLTQERCAADLRRRAAQAEEAGERVKALQARVDQLNGELNKSIFDILAIYEFTTVLGGTLQLKEILNMMVDTIMRVVRYDACFLALIDGEGRPELKVARAFTPEQLERLVSPRLAEGLLGRVAQSGQPLIVPDLASQAWTELYPGLPYRSLLSLPLVIQGEAVGVLNLFKREANAFTQDDLRVLFIVTNQCAFAVQNGKLYEEMAKLAITDGLTGLYNHRYFYSCIEEAVDRADRTGRPTSIDRKSVV